MAKKMETDKFRKLLLAERERILIEWRGAREEGGAAEELADYDDHHPADAASETYERTKDYAIDENFRDLLERIDEALRKLDGGSYGSCDRCGEPINRERLKAIPYATLCIDCQETIERR